MKKFLLVLPVILVIISGCSLSNISQQTDQQISAIPQVQKPNTQEVVQNQVSISTSTNGTNPIIQLDSPTSTPLAGFKFYSNKEIGLSFQYPAAWPEPVFKKGEFDFYGGGYPDTAKSQWVIYLGEYFKDGCGGTPCYLTEINGYFDLDLATVLLAVGNKKDPRFAFSTAKELTLNGNPIVTYDEVSISEDKSVFVFNGGRSIRFSSRDSINYFVPFDKILGTISFTKTEKQIAFDACGKIDKYKSEPWYPNFIKNLSAVPTLASDITDACLALDKSLLIAVTKGSYCQAGLLYKYDILSNHLTKATVDSHNRGCVSWPTQFGKRTGDVIPLQAFGGDAGCKGNMYYNYDFVNNKIELKKECSKCEGKLIETCINY